MSIDEDFTPLFCPHDHPGWERELRRSFSRPIPGAGGDRLVVAGCDCCGYSLLRTVDLRPAGTPRYERAFSSWPLGDAGAGFRRRSDAEAYGEAVLAWFSTGDWNECELPDPQAAYGVRKQDARWGETRKVIFLGGAAGVDPDEGWEGFDPDGLLEGLPSNLQEIVQSSAQADGGWAWWDGGPEVSASRRRVLGLMDLVDAGLDVYRKDALSLYLDESIENLPVILASEAREGATIAVADMAYLSLLILARLRGRAPFHWLFSDDLEEVNDAIGRLHERLADAERMLPAARPAGAPLIRPL